MISRRSSACSSMMRRASVKREGLGSGATFSGRGLLDGVMPHGAISRGRPLTWVKARPAQPDAVGVVGEIDSKRPHGNLSSAIRLFVLDYFKNHAATI
jgi:hypothetical protein